MNLLLSTHNDDMALFACFTAIREKPVVVTVLDSYVQPSRGDAGCDKYTRRAEDTAACAVLGLTCRFLGFRDDRPEWTAIERTLRGMDKSEQIEHVWAPAVEDGGHPHHNKLGEIASRVFAGRVTHYMSYTPAGKSIGVPVPYEPEWMDLKLKALNCYQSQINHPLCAEHFRRSQEEYYTMPNHDLSRWQDEREDVLDWDFYIGDPPPRESGMIEVTLVRADDTGS